MMKAQAVAYAKKKAPKMAMNGKSIPVKKKPAPEKKLVATKFKKFKKIEKKTTTKKK